MYDRDFRARRAEGHGVLIASGWAQPLVLAMRPDRGGE